jgi:hypothetical protein
MCGAPYFAEAPLAQRNAISDDIDGHQARRKYQANRRRLSGPAGRECEVRDTTAHGQDTDFDVGTRLLLSGRLLRLIAEGSPS